MTEETHDEKPKNDVLRVTVEFECIFDPARKDGNSLTFMSTYAGDVTDKDTKEVTGHFYTPILGGMEFHDLRSGKTWLLRGTEALKLFLRVLEAQNGTEPVKNEEHEND